MGGDWLHVAAVIAAGFFGSAEFGSWCCVHPVVFKLNYPEQVRVQQGLLKTFGRMMPVGMILSTILAIFSASTTSPSESPAFGLRVAAAVMFTVALVSTVTINVPANIATLRWSVEQPESEWHPMRRRWHLFQGLRSWLMVGAFVCLSLSLR